MIDLAELAGSLLDLSVEVLATASEGEEPQARPAPPARFVGHGRITWDCELLAVHIVNVKPKVIDPRNESCAVVPEASLMVTLLQCIPTLRDKKLPTPAEMDASFRQLAVDGRALYAGLLRAWVEGSWPEALPCHMVKWDQLEPLPPDGALAGWRIGVRVQV